MSHVFLRAATLALACLLPLCSLAQPAKNARSAPRGGDYILAVVNQELVRQASEGCAL